MLFVKANLLVYMQLLPGVPSNWRSAVSLCPANSHVITAQANALTAFAVSAFDVDFWLGSSQQSGSSSVNRGWAWIDGTSAANLNCGAVNATGCGMWAPSEPKCVTCVVLYCLSCRFCIAGTCMHVEPWDGHSTKVVCVLALLRARLCLAHVAWAPCLW
jgi:hypothetical protein